MKRFQAQYKQVLSNFSKQKIRKKKFNFKKWITEACNSGINEIISGAKTVELHLGGMENYFLSFATNSNIESFNARLKLFRQRIRGVWRTNIFSSLELFNILHGFFLHLISVWAML